MNFFTIFTMPIVFLRHFYIIYYVETALHVTVPLNEFARLLPNLKGFTQNEDFGEKKLSLGL